MSHRIIYHPEAEAELDRLYADIVVEAGDRIAGDYVDGVISFIESLETFPERGSIRGEDVLILGIFARGRDITDDILDERTR
jgi:toxin ParE1/3/4